VTPEELANADRLMNADGLADRGRSMNTDGLANPGSSKNAGELGGAGGPVNVEGSGDAGRSVNAGRPRDAGRSVNAEGAEAAEGARSAGSRSAEGSTSAESLRSAEGSRSADRSLSSAAPATGTDLGSAERLVALRGATTVDADTGEAVMGRTRELLTALLERNGLQHDQLVSIIFTSTKDLQSAFPAVAARALGLGDVPLLCAGELDVIGGNPNTVRVLIHCYSTRPRASLRHVYLHNAKHLRDDLPE
jgi:chorismate mutase